LISTTRPIDQSRGKSFCCGDVDSVASFEARTSTTDASSRPRTAVGDLVSCPTLDLRTEPEHAPPASKVDDGAGHVGVAVLVDAHRVGRGEPEDVGNPARIDEVFGSNERRHIREGIRTFGSVRRRR
jgi:hypothetical protein